MKNIQVKKYLIVGVSVMIMALLVSCRSTRTIQTAINKKDTVAVTVMTDPAIDSAMIMASIAQKINNSKIDFETFSGRIKVDYSDQSGKNQNATAYVRIRKDSLIWVSLTGALNVEGFRALIRPDSVWVMDKLEKTYTIRSIASLQEITGLPFDFAALQDALVGNPLYFNGNNIISFEGNGSKLTALSVGEHFKHLLTMDTLSNQITQSKLDDVEEIRNRTCFIYYDEYTQQQGRNFSAKRNILVTEKTSVNVKMEFKQWGFDEIQNYPFNIPKSYKLK